MLQTTPNYVFPRLSQYQQVVIQILSQFHVVACVTLSQLLSNDHITIPKFSQLRIVYCSMSWFYYYYFDWWCLSPTLQFKIINSLALSFLHSPTLTSIHDHWKNIALTILARMHLSNSWGLWLTWQKKGQNKNCALNVLFELELNLSKTLSVSLQTYN